MHIFYHACSIVHSQHQSHWCVFLFLSNLFNSLKIRHIVHTQHCKYVPVKYPQERLLCTLNKLLVKQVISFHLFLDLDPFIFQCSLHNIEYIKFTGPQDTSIKVIQIHKNLLPSQVNSLPCRIYTMLTKILNHTSVPF